MVGVEHQYRASKNTKGGEERETLYGRRGSGRIDSRENEKMNKTGEEKLETDIAVSQRQKDTLRERERGRAGGGNEMRRGGFRGHNKV